MYIVGILATTFDIFEEVKRILERLIDVLSEIWRFI